jgi:hypothetical protein
LTNFGFTDKSQRLNITFFDFVVQSQALELP